MNRHRPRTASRRHLRSLLPRPLGASRAVVFLAAAVAAAAAGLAAPRLVAQTWVPMGPDGGPLREIAQAPGSPSVLYAVASGGGIFRSTDHGREWQLAGDQLGGRTLEDLVVDPNDDAVLYASVVGVGVEKSVDAGASWQPSSAGLPAPVPFVLSLAVDPADSSTVYAGTLNGPYKSIDAGAHWTAPAGAIAQQWVYALLVDAAHPATVYAGCDGGGFFKSTDGGMTWTARNAGLPSGVAMIDVAADPSSAGTLYVTDFAQVFRSDDGGESWTAGGRVSLDHLAVAPNGWIFGINSTGAWRSTDRGATWTPLSAPSPPVSEHGRGLIADASDPGLLFAATTSGLLSGAFYGATWNPASRGLTATTADRVAIAAGAPPTVYASVDGLGVVRSPVPPPGAATGRTAWQPANGNLPLEQQSAGTALAIDPRHPTILWRGTFFGAASSADGGATWNVATIPDDCMIVLAIALDPTRSGTVYVAGTAYQNSCDTFDSHAWKTTNGGATWRNLPFGAGTLKIDPTHPAVVYSIGGGLFRSADGGLTWEDVSPAGGTLAVFDLAIDPTRTATLYGATSGGVWKSANGGRTWRAAGHGLPAGSVTGIAVDPRHPADVYAIVVLPVEAGEGSGGAGDPTGPAAIFRSTDGAATWSPYGTGLPHDELKGLLFDAADPDHLYALTGGYGLYRLSPTPPAP